MTNIYKYMRQTSKQVAIQGIIPYLEEYSHKNEIIRNSNFHLPLLRIIGSKGKGRPKTKDRPGVIASLGRAMYENLSKTDWKDITPFLAANELILSSTYLIDDIVDKQEKRFNNDSTWKKFGLNEAIFAGFRLREITEKIIIDKQKTSLENKLKLLGLISDIHRKTYEGQSLNDKLLKGYDHETYLERGNYFGGIFYGCVAEGSAILANVDEKSIKLARKIGYNYGAASMIRNDLKDFMTTELINSALQMSKALKRTPLEDFRIGRITYPLNIALDSKYKNKLEPLLGKLSLTPKEENEIVSMVARSGAFDETIALIENYKQRALEYLEKLSENESRDRLKDLIGLMKNSKDYTKLMKGKF